VSTIWKTLKPWQIGLFAVAAIALAVSIISTLRSSDDLGLATRLDMVDILTGDRYVVKIPGSGSMNIPGKNPATGESTLVPYYQDETGAFKVNDRYAMPLVKRLKGAPFAFDQSTFAVTFSDKDVQTIVGE
jgi:hypothetical protein